MKKIKILHGGPYEVDSDIPMTTATIETDEAGTSEHWRAGKHYENHPKMTDNPNEPYHLCRCGHSKNKPYCDGTHKDIGFAGTEYADHDTPYRDGCKVFEGDEIDLLDNGNLCASMRFCDRGIGVWDATIQSANPDNMKLAIEEACNCASGRLTIIKKDGTPIEPELAPEVSPIEDTAAGQRGPLWVKGGIELTGADGKPYEVRNRMTLCRCGESENMPFCDISHMNCPHMKGFDK